MSDAIVIDDPRADEELDLEAFERWKKWFKENCSD